MTTDPPKASKLGRWQFSLRTLLGGVTFVAVGCMALVNANGMWATCMLAAVLAMLCVGSIRWAVLRGPRRAFWFGFSIVGWSYFILVPIRDNDRNYLVTTSVLRKLHPIESTDSHTFVVTEGGDLQSNSHLSFRRRPVLS